MPTPRCLYTAAGGHWSPLPVKNTGLAVSSTEPTSEAGTTHFTERASPADQPRTYTSHYQWCRVRILKTSSMFYDFHILSDKPLYDECMPGLLSLPHNLPAMLPNQPAVRRAAGRHPKVVPRGGGELQSVDGGHCLSA